MSGRVLGPTASEAADRTVCEVSCRLVSTSAAKKTGSTRGLAYPTVQVSPKQVQHILSDCVPIVHLTEEVEEASAAHDQPEASTSGSSLVTSIKWLVVWAQRRWPARLPAACPAPQGLAWHHTRQWLAVGCSELGAVAVYDLEGAPATANGSMDVPRVETARWTLCHELQQQVGCLAWRPVLSSMLAVGCAEGVALWSLGTAPLPAAGMQKSGPAGSAWVTFLHFKRHARVAGLSWSPDGRLLAGAADDCNRIVVWDVGLGLGTTLRLSLAPNPLLAWSPDANYLLLGGQAGRVFLCETSRWTLRSWELPGGASLVAAAWSPSSRMVLLALSGSSSLVALHLVAPPPALTEQMLPVHLPEVSNCAPAAGGYGAGPIAGMVWDGSGQRLAVALRRPHPKAGSVALYSTSYDPVVTCHFIGYLHAFPELEEQLQQEHEDQGAESSGVLSLDPALGVDGAKRQLGTKGNFSKGLEMAFAPCCSKANAVLSVRATRGHEVCNIAMYI